MLLPEYRAFHPHALPDSELDFRWRPTAPPGAGLIRFSRRVRAAESLGGAHRHPGFLKTVSQAVAA
jgi:hypothetical protein